jgi:hypothetical protein
MTSTFTQIGGARIGFINATWPLALLVQQSTGEVYEIMRKRLFDSLPPGVRATVGIGPKKVPTPWRL